jgi:hypothetical protein
LGAEQSVHGPHRIELESKMTKNQLSPRRHINSLTGDPIGSTLSSLAKLSLAELRITWARVFDFSAPSIRSSDFLLRALAWKIQAAAGGELDKATERRLIEVAKALEGDGSYEPKIRSDLLPGVVLTREWKGVLHQVTVTKVGFDHAGRSYKSLSDIARTITGTRWSGPRFFGLEKKRDATRVAS